VNAAAGGVPPVDDVNWSSSYHRENHYCVGVLNKAKKASSHRLLSEGKGNSMKKLMLATTVLALGGMSVQNLEAGACG